MKVLQLNVWTGRLKYGLLRFFEAHKNEFDVICLQEAVWSEREPEQLEYFSATVDQIKQASGLEYEYRATNWGIQLLDDCSLEQGNVILTKSKIVKAEEIPVYGVYNGDTKFKIHGNEHYYNAIKVELDTGETVLAYHGYWLRNPLGDETTVACMRKVADSIKNTKRVIMCGDLNVTAESPAMRELDFLHDLTAENEIETTLTGIGYNGKVPCDHILVSDDFTVKSYQVLPDLISDHCAVLAEIN